LKGKDNTKPKRTETQSGSKSEAASQRSTRCKAILSSEEEEDDEVVFNDRQTIKDLYTQTMAKLALEDYEEDEEPHDEREDEPPLILTNQKNILILKVSIGTVNSFPNFPSI
jgi:hypothetical protein